MHQIRYILSLLIVLALQGCSRPPDEQQYTFSIMPQYSVEELNFSQMETVYNDYALAYQNGSLKAVLNMKSFDYTNHCFYTSFEYLKYFKTYSPQNDMFLKITFQSSLDLSKIIDYQDYMDQGCPVVGLTFLRTEDSRMSEYMALIETDNSNGVYTYELYLSEKIERDIEMLHSPQSDWVLQFTGDHILETPSYTYHQYVSSSLTIRADDLNVTLKQGE